MLILNSDDVVSLLPPLAEQIELTRQTFSALREGDVELPAKVGVHARPDGFLHAMPAYVGGLDAVGMKWIGGSSANKAKGLPYLSGLIVLNDPETMAPVALLDATTITAARTAAVTGLCVLHFAPEGWSSAAIVGCGMQGTSHATMLTFLNPQVALRAFDRHPERAAVLTETADVAASPREAIEGADVVITAIPFAAQLDPRFVRAWLGDDYLVLPIDFDACVQADIVHGADLFAVDSIDQFDSFRRSGGFAGWPAATNLSAALATPVASKRRPRRVVCCNLGIGALDVVFAQRIYASALERGVGAHVTLQ